MPFKVQVTQTPEEKEKQEIQEQAKNLFSAKDFDKLDALARKHRESKEHYADGAWKLNEVYAGICLDKQASEAQWQEHLAALEDWVKAKPASITARVALADELVTYAWKARGGGYANVLVPPSETRARCGLGRVPMASGYLGNSRSKAPI